MVVLALTPLNDIGDWARSDGLLIVLYVLGALLLTRFVNWLEHRITSRIDLNASESDALVRSEASKHRHAVAQVLNWVSVVLIYCVTAVLVAERLGIPISSLVAPATVAGVALGFGAQRVVQDLLAGFFLIAERQYGFGDVIRISPLGATEGVTGTVEDLTLRITQVRSANGEVVIVPNGQIVQVTNLSRDWARAVIDVPVPVTADVVRVNRVLHRVGLEAYEDPALRPLLLDIPTVMGVESLTVDEVKVRMVARTLPGKQFDVSRALKARVALSLRALGIQVQSEEIVASGAERSGSDTAATGVS